jgi:hypothetical protein
MKPRKSIKLIHEGKYAAEVEITLLEEEHEWAPYLSFDDLKKLEAVRAALRSGDLKAAARLARVYQLTPIAAE